MAGILDCLDKHSRIWKASTVAATTADYSDKYSSGIDLAGVTEVDIYD